MKLYKLTDSENRTQNGTIWGKGVTHTARGAGSRLCTSDVIHAYTDPYIAVFMNPLHANINKPIMWEARGNVIADDGTKVGVKSLTTIRKIKLVSLSYHQKVAIGIKCAFTVYKSKEYKKWGENWLNGIDRSSYDSTDMAAAYDAAYAAYEAARNINYSGSAFDLAGIIKDVLDTFKE